jgi:signal transduction histidine kinase
VRVRDETLGIVSHDLRNPLTKISLSAELLEGSSPEDQRDLIDTIRSASRQAQRLIQDLLDVARVEAGRFSVKKAWLDTGELLDEACRSNAPLAEQKSLQIVCSAPDGLPQVCADHDRMLQVFGNLIGNAIKFSPPGSTIRVSAAAVDKRVVFSVADEGPGIPEEDLPNLFRAYWQAKKTAHMGAGLGLAIVRGIVEAHGGHVLARNAERGAVFEFSMPFE